MLACSMYSRMMKLVNATDNLYLTPAEQRQLLEYTQSLPQRFAAARAVEAKELEIAEHSMSQLRRLYPTFESFHQDGWDKGIRDAQLVLRYNVQAMLMDDPEVANDKLLGWMRSLLTGFDLTPRMVRDTYAALRESCRAKLPAEAYALLEPHLERTIEVLSDIPEPAVAAV